VATLPAKVNYQIDARAHVHPSQKHSGHDQLDKVPVVCPSDTIIDVGAVMVEIVYTAVAHAAMLGRFGDSRFTYLALIGVYIAIPFVVIQLACLFHFVTLVDHLSCRVVPRSSKPVVSGAKS